MATTLDRPLHKERLHDVTRTDEFHAQGSEHSPGFNWTQRLGRVMWFPMFLMALMAFPTAVAFSIVRADEIASGGNADTIASLGHLVPGFMFLGFVSVFSAVSFAIARILGAFREGGGEVQEAAGATEIQTLRRPWTAWAFLAGMMMAMMILLTAVVLRFVAAAVIADDSASALEDSEQWGIWLEAVSRVGVVLFLFSIALGLASIITVLRFQSVRIRELVTKRD